METLKNIFRVIYLFAFFLPLLLVFIFPSFLVRVEIPYKLENSPYIENALYINIDRDELFSPSIKNFFRNIFNSTFNQFYYKVCFLNNVQIEIPNERIEKPQVTLRFFKNNINVPYKSIDVDEGQYGCHVFNIEDSISFSLHLDTVLLVKDVPDKIDIKPDILPDPDKTTIEPLPIYRIQNVVLFLIAWYSLLILLRKIINEVSEGTKYFLVRLINNFYNNMEEENKPQTAHLDSEQARQEQEKKDLKIEVLEKVSSLATAGFGLVAALAWNDAIKAMFDKLFPQPGGNLIALTSYALIITIIVVIITIQLGRLVNLAKKQLGKGKNQEDN